MWKANRTSSKRNVFKLLQACDRIEQMKKKIGVGIKKGFCFRCGKKILPKENYNKIITMWDGKVIEECWFHQSCWQEFNQEKVNERMQQIAQIGLKGLVAMKGQYA